MKLKKTILVSTLLLLVGGGCSKEISTDQKPTKTTPTNVEINEPFDTNDYLDQALDDLEAVE